MEVSRVKEEIVDLTEDSGSEKVDSIKREEITQPFSSDDHLEKKSPTQLKKEPAFASDQTQFNSRLSFRNVDKNLDKAIDEIKKGGSLSVIASYYGLSEDLIYQTIVSRSVTHQIDMLTKNEEKNLVKWILRSNKSNSLVMKQHLLEKVGKMKKVLKITPIFARSKFGRMWYAYFLKSNPEIVEDDGVLLPATEPKKEPDDLVSLYGLKQAVVVLEDYRKQTNFLSTLNIKVSEPEYLREDVFNVKVKDEDLEDHLSNDGCQQLIEMDRPRGITEIKDSPSDDDEKYSPTGIAGAMNNCSVEDTFTSNMAENKYCDYITKKIVNTAKSTRKKLVNKTDIKPTCSKCQKSFCNKAKLQRHMFTHIPKELYTISCYKCLKRFPSKYHFLVHLKITHSDIDHTCSDCGKVFKHQTSLRKHFKQEHCNDETPDNPKTFICDICTKSFRYKNSLEAHIMYSHLKEDKLHFCNICNKRFIKRSLMLRHQTRHSKTKPLACANCKKTFSRKYILMQHMEKCDKQKRPDADEECQKLSMEFISEIALD